MFYASLFGGHGNKHTMMNFSFAVQGAVPNDSTPVKFTYIWHFEQVGINAEKSGKTRIRFNRDLFPTLAINILKAPYSVTLSFLV